MVLVDTNVLVALLVRNTPWHTQARQLLARDPHWRSESHALVELSNVLLRLVRAKEFSADLAVAKLAEAEVRFGDDLVLASHAEALNLALHIQASAYDARFLVAAQKLGIKLTTEDAKLRRAAPGLCQSLDQALAACP